MPERIDHTSAAAPQIYRAIRGRIIAGHLAPGSVLSESEVAATYDVSRQPVREAFIRLAKDGLVQIRPQRGTYVTEIAVDAVLNARFVREAIEVAIVRAVAADPDPAVIADLRAQIDLQHAVAPGDAAAFQDLDERFHRSLAEAADQRFAWGVVEDLKAQMDRVRMLSYYPDHMSRLVAQHAAIVAAIAAADPARAEAAMRTHLREIIQSVQKLAAERPDLFAQDKTPKPTRRRDNETSGP
ncbi:MAG: GntR family transcriptional regulator [Alkalilacustris sp.]